METENLQFDQLRRQLHQLVLRLQDFINQQRAYAQTPEITKQDNKREHARGERIAERAGETGESIRKQTAPVLLELFKHTNALQRIAPSGSVGDFIQHINGVINHYKQVAASGGSHSGDEPEPTPVDPEVTPAEPEQQTEG